MHSKKFLIYGENWAGTLPNLLFNSLQKKGHPTTIFDFTDILPGIKERSISGRIKRRLFRQHYARAINTQFLRQFNEWQPDFVLIVKGLHLDREVLQHIKKAGAYLINWNPDDFLNSNNSNDNLIASIPDYDMIVSSREHRFPLYKQIGANKLLLIDWYFIPEFHYYEPCEKIFEASFVGSWSPSREDFISQLDKCFHIWGSGWGKSSSNFRKRHIVNHKILSQREMAKCFASSKYNLNMLTHENKDITNLRIFEVTASGGLLLTERNAFISKYLTEGEEALMYSSAEEVNRIFSQNPSSERIALAGMKRIVDGGNSFEDRVTVLLKALEGQRIAVYP